ncbi:MAG TPA: class II aldolase/adducin family protein [Methanomassiliicoccaceae archaeon]|nr:class II aldolase/adducin family protein [Euryarchaeota archaeon]HOB38534.1 class II aldolase/adducin family protein [Methanomassiliicoccaceae archaeon]HOK28111.1 class II aldolase/adducin family protein [Methanomassiliicoccaceae archaeon]HOQ26390.1 class II aldolase/adducin family protein [Methanomassiliicoccaceae archaeon]HPP44591.1 class II aldolase/adducin family protein [Methanomassiliicoccaceae archaeon]
MNEEDARKQLAATGRLAFDRRLTFGSGGNMSCRLDKRTMLITPSGTCKGLLAPEQMILVDIETGEYEGNNRPSMETPFHTGIYRSRPEVGAIIHCHPLSCTTLAVLGRRLRTALTPEGLMVLGDFVPIIAYGTPGSDDLAEKLVRQLGFSKACIMQSHGALATGRDLQDAFNRMETLEYIATLQLMAERAGEPEDLPEEEVERILSMAK